MSAIDPPQVRTETAIGRVTEPCNYCDQPIIWCQARQARMPVDAAPDPGGNVLVQLSVSGPQGLTATVITRPTQRDGLRLQGWTFRHHHKLTCPKASQWSRPSERQQAAEHMARGSSRR